MSTGRRGLRARAKRRGIFVPDCDETEYKSGSALKVRSTVITCMSAANGSCAAVDQDRQAARDRAELDESGYSCLYVAVDGKLAGLIPYADQVRPESREVIRTLHAMGIKNTIMLTGDNASVARAVGARLGLTRQFSDMMPEDKAAVIEMLKREGNVVAMVGDGINDSVALTYSDVGIAMRHGARIAHESAHVVLMEDSLWKLVKAVEVSRGAVSLIKQNYGIVAALNIVALGLALPSGLVGPHVTAILSNGSAILASINGMRPLMQRS